MPFEFITTPKLVVARGGIQSLCNLIPHSSRVLVVSDMGLVAIGLVDSLIKVLEAKECAVTLFSEVEADPSSATIESACKLAVDNRVHTVIGFGGGSSMDVAKLVATLAFPGNTQSLDEMYGVDLITGSRLPLIQIPTTAGTGSEVTPVAVVTIGEATKAGVVSPVLLPDAAILDVELTLGLPSAITAATGIDAMVHALEAYTSRVRKNPLSDMLAEKALKLMAPSLLKAVRNGRDLEAREAMLLGANLAGQAFANAPVAAVHALAYPLGGHYHIPHGLSNALVLPHVMQFNLPECHALYASLAGLILDDVSTSSQAAAQSLVEWFKQLLKETGLPTTLKEAGGAETDLPMLARDAMLQERLLINNPRKVSLDDALTIYRAAY